MENSLAVGSNQTLTALDIQTQVNLIQSVMKQVMQKDQHYGIIPGCKKPSLLKPGAEKIAMTFRLRPVIGNTDINILQMDGGHREITVYCHILNMDGTELSTGVGSCSTMESKYRYRGGEKTSTGQPVPKEYWNLKKEGKMAEALDTIGGKGFGTMKENDIWVICEHGEKMDNPDIADVYNTVLKMAKKRAYVDGILSATAASDIFTQDIEDLPPEAVHKVAETGTTEHKADTSIKDESTIDRTKMKAMKSLYDGECHECGYKIKKGDDIFYDGKSKIVVHAVCPEIEFPGEAK